MVVEKHRYRPELDGIRAVAVLAVLVFHLHNDWLPGGFVGVDVFFVLSGYLITGLLRRSVLKGTFSYRRFFVRRLRRLSPALMTMLVFASIGAMLVLPPATLVAYSRSLFWQPLALQNVHFLMVGDYFASPESKPLLHTWSLGVEEQFYLVWPFLILLFSKFSRRTLIFLLFVTLFASWALCLVLPLVSPKMAFFFFPARAWELGIGALIAVAQERETNWTQAIPAWIFAVLGVLGLAGSMVFINGDAPFPGWRAMIPALATGALVLGCTSGSPLTRVLSIRPLVLIGLGSYALYLWHWPLIVYARYAGFSTHSPAVALAISVLSAVCAYLSYTLVEEPIRRGRWVQSTQSLFGLLGVAAVVLWAFAGESIHTNGFESRYQEPRRAMLTAPLHGEGDTRCGFFWRATHPFSAVCRMGGPDAEKPGVLIWGNSHAAMWTGLLDEIADRPIYLNARNCRPYAENNHCSAAVVEQVVAALDEHDIHDVIFASAWNGYRTPPKKIQRRNEKLKAVIQRVVASGRRVWLVIDTPVGKGLDPVEWAMNPNTVDFPRLSFEEHQRLLEPMRVFFADLAIDPAISIIDPTEDFCDSKVCRTGTDAQAWYRDTNHLTRIGTRRSRQRFERVFIAP